MLRYEEIAQEISGSIRNGVMKPGQRLPSIREACIRYGCNKATVIRAYEELENQHLAAVRNKSGFYVLDIGTARSGHSGGDIDFARIELQKDLIPYQDFQHCMNNAIEKEKADLFCFSQSRGLKGLIREIRRGLMVQQVFADEGNIVITSGIQQALSLLCRMPFCCCKDAVLVEQPTFRGILYAIRHAGINAVGIERSYDGLDMNRVEQIFRTGRIKFFYVQPRYQNPLGTHLSEQQKKDLLGLAKQYDVYLVEDDYMADYDPVSANDPLAAGNLDRVIYLRSFSKILLPGVRIGAAVLPEELVSTFSEYKIWNDLSTSILAQGALEVYLKSGLMDRHVPSIRRVYQERMAAARAVLEAQWPHPFHVPDAGLFFSVELPQTVSLSGLKNDLKRQGILINDSGDYYLEGFRRKNILRIAVSNQTPDSVRNELPRILAAAGSVSPVERVEQWL